MAQEIAEKHYHFQVPSTPMDAAAIATDRHLNRERAAAGRRLYESFNLGFADRKLQQSAGLSLKTNDVGFTAVASAPVW